MRALIRTAVLCLTTCVAPSTAPVIGNEIPSSSPSTLARNVDATFLAWYRFVDTEDGSVNDLAVEVLAVDARHVLAISVEFQTRFYRSLRLLAIRVSRPGAADMSQAPWEARVVASTDGISVLETLHDLPTDGVRLSLREPREDDRVYVISGLKKDGSPRVVHGIVFDALTHADAERMMGDDVSKNVLAAFEYGFVDDEGEYVTFSGGTFDAEHDLVCFGGQSANYLKPVTKAQRVFFATDAFRPAAAALKTIHLMPLLRQAGVDADLR